MFFQPDLLPCLSHFDDLSMSKMFLIQCQIKTHLFCMLTLTKYNYYYQSENCSIKVNCSFCKFFAF